MLSYGINTYGILYEIKKCGEKISSLKYNFKKDSVWSIYKNEVKVWSCLLKPLDNITIEVSDGRYLLPVYRELNSHSQQPLNDNQTYILLIAHLSKSIYVYYKAASDNIRPLAIPIKQKQVRVVKSISVHLESDNADKDTLVSWEEADMMVIKGKATKKGKNYSVIYEIHIPLKKICSEDYWSMKIFKSKSSAPDVKNEPLVYYELDCDGEDFDETSISSLSSFDSSDFSDKDRMAYDHLTGGNNDLNDLGLKCLTIDEKVDRMELKPITLNENN